MVGREEQLAALNEHYAAPGKSNLTIVYGRSGIGKTALVREFIKDKEYLYFEAFPRAAFEMLDAMNRAFGSNDRLSYEDLFDRIINEHFTAERKLVIIENFQNIIKGDPDFMAKLADILGVHSDLMIVLTCSSVAWIENSMVGTIGNAALAINSFIKLKPLSYTDVVSMLPSGSTNIDNLTFYAITGGIPAYMKRWNVKASIRANVCNEILNVNGRLYDVAHEFLQEEFRETAIYNTLLGCLASGMDKLNDIHDYTGYGRDKISVYLGNLIEREIVEKVFSYDKENSESARKGCYRICDPIVNYWYRFVYPNKSVMGSMSTADFYDRYISGNVNEYLLSTFVKIGQEFMEILKTIGQLDSTYEYKGGYYGKDGDVHIIMVNADGKAVIGQCHVKNKPYDSFEHALLKENIRIAGLEAVRVYVFSLSGFAEDIKDMASDELLLMPIEEL